MRTTLNQVCHIGFLEAKFQKSGLLEKWLASIFSFGLLASKPKFGSHLASCECSLYKSIKNSKFASYHDINSEGKEEKNITLVKIDIVFFLYLSIFGLHLASFPGSFGPLFGLGTWLLWPPTILKGGNPDHNFLFQTNKTNWRLILGVERKRIIRSFNPKHDPTLFLYSQVNIYYKIR